MAAHYAVRYLTGKDQAVVSKVLLERITLLQSLVKVREWLGIVKSRSPGLNSNHGPYIRRSVTMIRQAFKW